MTFEQPTLPLEMPVYTHYIVELTKGAVGNMEHVRSYQATSVDGALNFVEGFRTSAASRDNVNWQSDEVDERGLLYGLAPGGVVFCITVVPPLSESLSDEG